MMTGWDRNQTLSPTLSSDHAVSLSVAHFRSSILKEPQPLRWNSSAENSSIALLGSPSPLCRLLVQQGHAVSQSNYMSIKGFVAQDSFCQRFGRSRLRGLCRERVNEISFHVEISREKALKGGIGRKKAPLTLSLSLSMGDSPSTRTDPHNTQHFIEGASGIEARGLWEYSWPDKGVSGWMSVFWGSSLR